MQRSLSADKFCSRSDALSHLQGRRVAMPDVPQVRRSQDVVVPSCDGSRLICAAAF